MQYLFIISLFLMIYDTTYLFYNIFLWPQKYPGGIRIQIRSSGFLDLRIQIWKKC